MASQNVDPTAAQANAAGLAALRAGNYAQAVHQHRTAAAADPQSGALQRNLATTFRAMGDDEGELQALSAAVALDARDLIAWLRTAQLHTRRGDEAHALSAWNAVIQLAQGLTDLPQALVDEITAGQQAMAAIQTRMSAGIEARVGDSLAALDGRDARRARAFLDATLGKRRIYTDQCSGLHYPFLPADEYFDEEHFPWFPELARHTDAIRAEALHVLQNCQELFRPYVQMPRGGNAGPWSGLDGKLDWGACFLWEYGTRNEALVKHCPATFAALAKVPLATLPNRAPTAFFSVLKAGKVIPPHTGVTNTRAIVHLPLVAPPDCAFRVGGETRPWVEGVPFAFSDTIDHEAWNRSDRDRIVLIIDVWNPHLSEAERGAITRFCDAADAAGLAPQFHDIGN